MSNEQREEEGKKSSRRRRHLRLTRDAIIFYTGWGGIIHQTLLTDSDRVSLLILFASMIGLPTALRWDEWKKGKE